MIEKTFYCDGCARRKKDTEVWWQIQKVSQRGALGLVLYTVPQILLIRPFSEEGAEHWHCYCSQQHAITAVLGYMGDNLTKKEV